MKKYVFKKGDESVTVETDAFGTISNFMITGVIGKNYNNLVQAGFNLRTGYSTSSAAILNVAKMCEAEVKCYDGDRLVTDESEDFVPTLKNLKINIAKDKPTYEQFVPESYRKDHTFESENGFPWVVVTFDRVDANDKYNMTVKMKHGAATANTDVVFAKGVDPSKGTLSSSDKVLTTTAKEYLLFKIADDLQVSDGTTTSKKFKVEINYKGEDYSAEVTAS